MKAGVATADPKGLPAAAEVANRDGVLPAPKAGALDAPNAGGDAPNNGALAPPPNADGVAKPKLDGDAPKAGVEPCP